MHKSLIAILLTLVSTSAMADWTLAGEAANSNFSLYVDRASIHRKGDRVKMWHLYDYKSAEAGVVDGKFYLSSKGQNEYDCSEDTLRILAYSNHTESMGLGDILSSDYSVKRDWQAIAPNTIYMMLLKVACGK